MVLINLAITQRQMDVRDGKFSHILTTSVHITPENFSQFGRTPVLKICWEKEFAKLFFGIIFHSELQTSFPYQNAFSIHENDRHGTLFQT